MDILMNYEIFDISIKRELWELVGRVDILSLGIKV